MIATSVVVVACRCWRTALLSGRIRKEGTFIGQCEETDVYRGGQQMGSSARGDIPMVEERIYLPLGDEKANAWFLNIVVVVPPATS